MTKLCSVCGTEICTEDWYSFIRTKYCRNCAERMRRMQQAERMRTLRAKRREVNRLSRELCASQQQEIALLRAELIRQRERIARLNAAGGDEDA